MHRIRLSTLSCVLVSAIALTGCHLIPHEPYQPPPVAPPVGGDNMPKELSKVVLPTYTIEPPDILVVEALHLVPRPPYHLRSQDVLSISVENTLPDYPIGGPNIVYPIEPGGVINLGNPYGTVKVAGLTTEEAKAAIETHLREFLREPLVSVSLLSFGGSQQIAGQHLVGPDGTLTLGSYGSVSVVGMTLVQAKQAIEMHLSQFLDAPEVSVDVFAYNSKVYYIITEGAGLGDSVTRFPITGNETVLDAVSNVNGTTQLSSNRIWIARPTPYNGELQILPVDWKAITGQGQVATNYQILPGDRIFIAEDKLVAFDTSLGKVLAPVERIFGFTTFGVSTVSRLSGSVLRGGGLRGAGFSGF